MNNCKTVTLSNGVEMPMVGLGTYKCAGNVCSTTVKYAIECGYRHIDGALYYLNEREIGQAVAEAIQEGTVRRSDLFLTSKLWNTFHGPEMVRPALDKTLKDLGTDYIDLYLLHWPISLEDGWNLAPVDSEGKCKLGNAKIEDTWKELEKCVKLGMIKSLGVSNFNNHQILKLLQSAEIKPVVNQVEAHVYFLQNKLNEFCKSVGIHVISYRSFGDPPSSPLIDPVVVSIAEKHKKNPANILLKFFVQRGISVIPKSVTKERIKSNLDIFDFMLTPEDLTALSALDKGEKGRGMRALKWAHSPDYPFNNEY